MFTSVFGDVFFRAADGFWWLDTLEGTLTRRWQTPEDLRAKLNTAQGQDQYLLAGLALAAGQAGLVPGAGQILSFRQPPALGGRIEIGNIEVSDFAVAVNIAGQIRDQIRGLPRHQALRRHHQRHVSVTTAADCRSSAQITH